MGVGAGACRMLGTAPLEVAAFAFVLKGRGESLQSPGSGANSIAKGRGWSAQERQGLGKEAISHL